VSTSVITVGGESITLVDASSSLLAKSADFKVFDAVGKVDSSFTGQSQRQAWPGNDLWWLTLTMPPLSSDDADTWECFLLEMRGMRCAAQFADPRRPVNKGTMLGTPLADDSVTGANAAMSTTLGVKGLTPSSPDVLKKGDYFQLGYWYHRCLDDVDADGSGKALIPIWPSLRKQPNDGAAINWTTPMGLFALAANDRAWSGDVTRFTRLSVALQEYR
jgi:hypothetical protein